MIHLSRRIDHLVIAVRNLDAAAEFYQRLGFQVGARNLHPWGTENRLVQFGSSFLELITVGDAADIPPHSPGHFSFGAFVRDYLAKREGLAMLVLDSVDAAADAKEFARQGIGRFAPFTFERSGQRSDGVLTRVGFSLAFAIDDRLPDAGFFVCQQHHPEAFWDPRLQHHHNGASQVVAVTLDVDDPGEHADFLGAFTGTQRSEDGNFRLAGGELRLRSPHPRSDLSGCSVLGGFSGFSGIAVSVPDLDQVAQRLGAEHIPFHRLPERLTLDPDQCFGARIDFETAPRT